MKKSIQRLFVLIAALTLLGGFSGCADDSGNSGDSTCKSDCHFKQCGDDGCGHEHRGNAESEYGGDSAVGLRREALAGAAEEERDARGESARGRAR